jgi:hypothetical protein
MTFRGNHVDELISASLSGDLTDAERAELDAHLVRCETCRATLAAFTAERRILSGMPVADPPPDLPARIRAGIESGRFGRPWWRRPSGVFALGASLATVATAVLAVVIFGNLDFAPVGQQSNSPVASGSVAPGPTAVETSPATERPTPVPAFALGPGELGYLSLTGAPLEPLQLSFINDATGSSIDAGTVAGPPIAASLAPDGRWLAYITQKGETGANEVWALGLVDGKLTHLGCSSAAVFTNRLAWSPDSHYLAYTLVGVDLGPDAGCEAPSNGADAWIFDGTTGVTKQLTHAGNAYAASFIANDPPELAVSFAAEKPRTASVNPVTGARAEQDLADNIFLPLFSPDGNRALFWSGTMNANGGSWHFSLGGMPQVSQDMRSAGPASPWVGTPLFTDLVPVGGAAFASGDFRWGPDSDQFTFWDGAWNGVSQSADGTYPSQGDVYTGRVGGGLLSQASRAGIDLVEGAWIVDAAISGSSLAITVGLPTAGIGDPPSAYVQVFHDVGGDLRIIGGGVEPPPWDGPAVFGW